MPNDYRKTPAERRRDERICYLRDLVYFKMSPKAIAEKLEVDLATVKRWLEGNTRIPLAAILALEALQGRLPGMANSWKWERARIDHNGDLWVEGYRQPWHPGHLQGAVWDAARLEGLERENRKLQAELDKAREELAKTDIAANDGDAWKHGWPEPLPAPLADVSRKPKKNRA